MSKFVSNLWILTICVFLSCEGPKEDFSNGPESPVEEEKIGFENKTRIQIGYRDNSIHANLENHLKESDFDVEGNYKKIAQISNLEFLKNKDIFNIPIRLSTKARDVYLDYYIDGLRKHWVFRDKFLGSNTDEVNFIFDQKSVEIDILKLNKYDVSVFTIKAILDNNEVVERSIKFKFEPVFTGNITLEVASTETCLSRTWKRYTIMPMKPAEKKSLPHNFGIRIPIANKEMNFYVPSIMYWRGDMEGPGMYKYYFYNHINQGAYILVQDTNHELEYYLNVEEENYFTHPIYSQSIEIKNLKYDDLNKLKIRKVVAANGGRVSISRVNVIPDEFLREYIKWQVRLSSEEIEFYVE